MRYTGTPVETTDLEAAIVAADQFTGKEHSMGTKAQVKTQAKTPGAPGQAHVGQPPVAVPEREAELPDIAAQLEGAARLGHSLGAISVDGSPPPIIQRQELPEEEEEELQMKREPAAIQRQELPEEEEEELQMKPEPAALQRQELPDEEKELQTKLANGVQRQGGGEGFQLDDETAGRINRARGGGQPLEGALQEQMSASLGHDFIGVRVHTDAEADDLSQRLRAKAFTTGPHIFFKRSAYDPASSSGRELIAHELTHVVQQKGEQSTGASSSTFTVRPSGDEIERQAEVEAAWLVRASEENEVLHATPARKRISSVAGVSLTNEVMLSPADEMEGQRWTWYGGSPLGAREKLWNRFEFGRWVMDAKDVEPEPTRMNCFEAVLLAHYKAGERTKMHLKYDLGPTTPSFPAFINELTETGRQVEEFTGQSIARDNVVALGDGQHVVLSTGSGAVNSKDKQTYPEVLSLDRNQSGVEKTDLKDAMLRHPRHTVKVGRL